MNSDMDKELDVALMQFTEAIQDIAVKAVSGTKPTEIRIAEVVSVEPLSICLPGSFTISKETLILTKNVMDYEIEVDMDLETETASNHKHNLKGKKTIKIKNGLKIGDRVLVLRSQGGDRYIVVDKFV